MPRRGTTVCDPVHTALTGDAHNLCCPERAKVMRRRGLSMVVLGLLIKVYWGGYGPWQAIDFPILVTLRTFLEPILLYGGAVLYVFGWIASFI